MHEVTDVAGALYLLDFFIALLVAHVHDGHNEFQGSCLALFGRMDIRADP
jgi:hypothetical protein